MNALFHLFHRVPARRWIVLVAVLVLPATVIETSGADRHCLWKVEGAKTVVHLLGSVHVLKKQDYPLATPIEKAFEQSAIVCFEADIAAMDNPKTQASLLEKGRLPTGQKLENRLTEETYAKLAGYLKEAGLPGNAFDTFQPWFAGIGLLGLELPKLGLDPEYGVDKHYHKRAVKAGKIIVPLETVEFQLNLFASLGQEDGEEFLQSTLKDIANVRTMLADLVKAWRQGDLAKLDTLLNEAFVEHPRIRQRFFTDRNQSWVKEIEKLLQGDKPALVVAGAGHMIGQDSVVDRLRKKGFKVTQQ